jgi:hypothetical protein
MLSLQQWCHRPNNGVIARLDRATQYAAASRFYHPLPLEYWIARSSRATTSIWVACSHAMNCYRFNFQTSRHRYGNSPLPATREGAWREGRSPCTASHSRRVCSREVCRKRSALVSEGAGNAGRPMRPIAACAMVVVERTRVSQVTPVSPGTPRAMVYGLYRALPGDRALLPPSPLRSLLLKNLTPASGRQDHTSSPSASGALVLKRHLRPPHPAPRP